MAKRILTEDDKAELEKKIEKASQSSGGNVENGEDGFSPIAKVEQTASGAVISITDKDVSGFKLYTEAESLDLSNVANGVLYTRQSSSSS